MNRPDASMTLLRDLQEGALEPEYREGSRRPPSRLRFGFTVTLLVLLITVAALQTTRGAGTAADQRAQLLERIASARTQQAELSALVTSLEGEIRDLGDAAIGDPATLPARFNETDAAQWWHYLTQNYGLTLSIKVSEDDLELPADSGMTLRYAERG